MSDLTILRRLSASDVPLSPAVTVRPDDRAQRLLELSEEYAGMDFIVVDEQGNYAGMVTGGDLKAALVYREAIPLLQVNELQRTDLPTVSPDEHLDLVLDKFSRYDVQSLAMMADAESNLAVGLITRSQLMRRYQSALDED
jgi:CIC family chloride channel protein